MPLASWLFVKGVESIWVERPAGYAIIVAGPGTRREDHDFADEQSLDSFQMRLAERLTEQGWFLWGFDRERRSGTERRQHSRPSTDRRRHAGNQMSA